MNITLNGVEIHVQEGMDVNVMIDLVKKKVSVTKRQAPPRPKLVTVDDLVKVTMVKPWTPLDIPESIKRAHTYDCLIPQVRDIRFRMIEAPLEVQFSPYAVYIEAYNLVENDSHFAVYSHGYRTVYRMPDNYHDLCNTARHIVMKHQLMVTV